MASVVFSTNLTTQLTVILGLFKIIILFIPIIRLSSMFCRYWFIVYFICYQNQTLSMSRMSFPRRMTTFFTFDLFKITNINYTLGYLHICFPKETTIISSILISSNILTYKVKYDDFELTILNHLYQCTMMILENYCDYFTNWFLKVIWANCFHFGVFYEMG